MGQQRERLSHSSFGGFHGCHGGGMKWGDPLSPQKWRFPEMGGPQGTPKLSIFSIFHFEPSIYLMVPPFMENPKSATAAQVPVILDQAGAAAKRFFFLALPTLRHAMNHGMGWFKGQSNPETIGFTWFYHMLCTCRLRFFAKYWDGDFEIVVWRTPYIISIPNGCSLASLVGAYNVCTSMDKPGSQRQDRNTKCNRAVFNISTTGANRGDHMVVVTCIQINWDHGKNQSNLQMFGYSDNWPSQVCTELEPLCDVSIQQNPRSHWSKHIKTSGVHILI